MSVNIHEPVSRIARK